MSDRYPNAGSRHSGRHSLQAFNETQDARQLHPTKGWRKLNVKRSRAQALVAQTMSGVPIPLHLQRRFIVDGY